MSGYFEMARATYLENWPAELLRLSFASTFLSLGDHEVDALLGLCDAVQYGEKVTVNQPALERLAGRISSAAARYPFGVFVRLGSRSPKDAWLGYEAGFRCIGDLAGRRALDLFAQSERIYEDLHLAKENHYRPVVVVREWKDIPAFEEWRVLVRGRRIIGASQYDYHREYPPDAADLGSVRAAIDHYWGTELRAALPLDDVVADLWVNRRTVSPPHRSGRSGPRVVRWTVKLVEINPFFDMTDPCLFAWRDIDQWSKAEPYEIRIVAGANLATACSAPKLS